jgi:molybdopterin-binding protein
MHTYRIGEAAALMGVSADTLRRWVDGGKLPAQRDNTGRRMIPGADLAAFARKRNYGESQHIDSSARNRLAGIVTEVIRGDVSALVEIQAGPFRVASMISRKSADEMALEPGVPALAVIKSTNVVIEKA